MHASKYSFIYNTDGYYKENKCDLCNKTPAIFLEADCHGDSCGPFCKECWIKHIDEMFAEKENMILDVLEGESIEIECCNIYGVRISTRTVDGPLYRAGV